MEEKKIKILQIVPDLGHIGGIENVVLNWYRFIDKSKFQFDIISHGEPQDAIKNEIEQLGGKIIVFPKFTIKNLKIILSNIERTYKSSNYDIIHCHCANMGWFYFRIAKKLYGDKVPRILHSHQQKAADKFTHIIRNIPLLYLANKTCTDRLACSKVAGDFLFKNNNYKIIHNGIDIEKFKFNKDIRNKLRNAINEGTVIFGFVGRLTKQKNPLFVIDVFNEYIKLNNDSLLWIIGEGEYYSKIRERVNGYQIDDKVIFLGKKDNVNELLQAVDIVLLPSFYEGLSLVAVEAQAAGVQTYISNKISCEHILTNNCSMLPLNKPAEYWAKKINKNSDRENSRNLIAKSHYDILEIMQDLKKTYLSWRENV